MKNLIKRSLLFSLLFMNALSMNAQSERLLQLRNVYARAPFHQASFDSLEVLVNNSKESMTDVFEGYRACMMMLRANYLFNPFHKYQSFANGRASLEALLSRNASNMELRYLRYTIQSNAPAFLGYHKNLDTDRKFLIEKTLLSSDNNLIDLVQAYLEKQSNVSYLTSKRTKS